MITGIETNKVYFSEILRNSVEFRSTFKRIQAILDKYNINYGFLSNTKSIWCRDFMPIQVAWDRFLQFRYEPSYLVDSPALRSNPCEVLNCTGLTAEFSTINLEGGNVVNWNDKLILTTRFLAENPGRERFQLLSELERLFDSKVFLIPDIKGDLTGHSDGHVRFIDSNTLLVNRLEKEWAYWKNGFLKMTRESGLTFVEMPWFVQKDNKYNDTAVGCYVNYLEIGDLVLFPVFEVFGNKDEEALTIIRSVFPERIVEAINVNEIGKYGGLMNCATWTIRA